MVGKASKDMFGKIMASYHCSHSLLPPPNENIHDLRIRGYNYPLPRCKFNLCENSL